ncbi:hypothetical protein SpiGrapes_0506 [Sphaerochaeta pleomorpha str. Grapes]|uniref:Uncharacterized protein n=1 Tax=Sphaerochaeta pleomorpha (strain ATCC BAA-1885 / DSM 22778 / Grapes) TaxID=158190 RepID=G8QWR6_SPHPG|nr:hypothetical protein SpiGrapes_0506 [Sphaerochaeta pleomorpha str. Grapes]
MEKNNIYKQLLEIAPKFECKYEDHKSSIYIYLMDSNFISQMKKVELVIMRNSMVKIIQMRIMQQSFIN